MDKNIRYDLANSLLNENEEVIDEALLTELANELTSLYHLTPYAAASLVVLLGLKDRLMSKLKFWTSKDETKIDSPLERAKIKISKQIENYSSFYNDALGALHDANNDSQVEDVASKLAKKVGLTKEEEEAFYEYLKSFKTKLHNIKPLVVEYN